MRLQLAYLILLHAQMVSQYLVRVLAQSWGWASEPRLAVRVLDGRIHQLQRTALWMIYFNNHVPGPGVLVVQRRQDIVYSSIWQPLPLKYVQPFLRCFGHRDLLDRCLELVAVCHPRGIDLVFRIFFPFGAAQTITEDTKKAVVPAAKKDITILGFERLVWDDRSWSNGQKARFGIPDCGFSTYDEPSPTCPCLSLRL